MLSTYNNIIGDADIDYIKKEFAQLFDNTVIDDKRYINHIDTIRDVFKSTENQLLQQERINVNFLPVGKYIRNLLNAIINVADHTEIYFIRAYYPVGIHADADKYTTGKTILIPLTFSTDIKTLIFKETGTNQDFSNFVNQFINNPKQFKRSNLLSRTLNLKNCWFGTPSLTDFLNVDGIVDWNPNVVMIFDRMQFHGSNNYKDVVDSKDYVLIHTEQ